MVLGGEKPKAVKDLLRSMLLAWYDLTQHAARNFVTGAVATEQQQLETPEQVDNLIVSVLFHGWKLRALNPFAREQRNRANSNALWVQRMVAPTPARGGGVPGTSKSGTVLASLEASRDGHPLGSRYMRVCTIPPDRIRYGRSPAAPAAPVPTPPRHIARSRVTTRAAAHRSPRPGNHRARKLSVASTFVNEYLVNGHADRSHETSEQGQDYRRHNSNIGNGENIDSMESDTCRTSGSGCGGRRVPCPLRWDDMHPWEKRNASFLLCEDGGMQAHASEGSSVSAEVLREVSNRLKHHAHLEARQRNALALCDEARINQTGHLLPGSTARTAANTHCLSGTRNSKSKKSSSTRAGNGTHRKGSTEFVDETRAAIFDCAYSSRPGQSSERGQSWL